jgi:tetratricopeptide (TPR) repeat protein
MNPQWDKGWADLGTLYYATGKFPQAIAALKNSIAINPKSSQAWPFLGLTEFETKDYSNAYIHLDRARELDFRGTPAVMLLAIYHLAELRNLNGDFFGAADLLIPEVHQGRVNEQTKIILDWKKIADDAKKLNGRIEDNIYKHFLHAEADRGRDLTDKYDSTADWVKADADATQAEILEAQEIYVRWRDRAASVEGKGGAISASDKLASKKLEDQTHVDRMSSRIPTASSPH